MHKPFTLLRAQCVLLLLSAMASSADWPTYQASNERAGSTSQQLNRPLKQTWVFSSPSAPRRTWTGPAGRVIEGKELGDRVKFDDALHVAVVGDRLYFGSSVDHQVHCLDVLDGNEVWSFFTGGPIRLAPSVVDGRVYIGSDDGYACHPRSGERSYSGHFHVRFSGPGCSETCPRCASPQAPCPSVMNGCHGGAVVCE